MALLWIRPWADLAQMSIEMRGVMSTLSLPYSMFDEYPSSDSVVKADYVFPYIYMHYAPPPVHLNK